MKLVVIGASVSIFLGFLIILNLPQEKHQKEEKRYARVVTLAPSLTETMIALGQEHRLAGVTVHCQGETVKTLPKVGSFATPNFEAIMSLKPDLVLAVPHVMAEEVLERIKRHDIDVFAHQPDSLADIKLVILTVAKKLDVEERGLALCQKIDQAIAKAKSAIALANGEQKNTSTLIAVSHSPLVVAGKNTFASEIIESLGLFNMANGKTSWPVWPLEQLLSSPPHFLILALGKDHLPRYLDLFHALGLDLVSNAVQLIVPTRPIFNSPSPILIEDIVYLTDLLQPGGLS